MAWRSEKTAPGWHTRTDGFPLLKRGLHKRVRLKTKRFHCFTDAQMRFHSPVKKCWGVVLSYAQVTNVFASSPTTVESPRVFFCGPTRAGVCITSRIRMKVPPRWTNRLRSDSSGLNQRPVSQRHRLRFTARMFLVFVRSSERQRQMKEASSGPEESAHTRSGHFRHWKVYFMVSVELESGKSEFLYMCETQNVWLLRIIFFLELFFQFALNTDDRHCWYLNY